MKNKKIFAGIMAVAVVSAVLCNANFSQAKNVVEKTDGRAFNAAEYMKFDLLDADEFIGETESQEACLLETLSDEEFQAMLQDEKVQMHEAVTVNPDRYEPNDSWEEAFQYSQTEKLSGNLFIEGYVSSNCHETGDEDWFEIGLQSRYTYDVVLKNVCRQDKHIYIWGNPYGTWEKWGHPNPQTGKPEKFTFTPETTYRYYIQIVGGEPEISSFFFAVERQGTINTALYPYELDL